MRRKMGDSGFFHHLVERLGNKVRVYRESVRLGEDVPGGVLGFPYHGLLGYLLASYLVE